jgi:GTP:adenosylcobinamide-phosphate guanylyltransferase
MVRYVVDALRAAEHVGDVTVICGPGGPLPPDAVDGVRQTTAASKAFSDTVAAAARSGGNGPVLLVTADVPLLTPQAVDQTARFALDRGADLTYTMAEAEQVAAAFPETKRTSVRLREGRFTGGNLVVADRDSLLHSLAVIQAAFARRKSIIGLALLLGPVFVVRLALGRLTIEAVARRGSEVLGCSIAVHLTKHPEVAFDVDKPSDLAAAEAAMAGRLR